MSFFLRLKVLSTMLICVLLLPSPTVQASESDPSLTVTLEKMVQFFDPEGAEVLVPAGTYSVEGRDEQFTLSAKDSEPKSIEATTGSHSTEIPVPTIVSIPGDETDVANAHLLILFYPDGRTLQAVGLYSEVTSRGLPEMNEGDPDSIDPSRLTFDKPVYFIAPDGGPLIVKPGTYTAEAAPPWIRLIPGQDRQDALLIEAEQDTHDTGVEELLALSIPGTTPAELDVHHVLLLLPTGQSLEANGSYSGIQKRGPFWKKKKKKSRKKKSNWFTKASKRVKTSIAKAKRGRAARTLSKAGKTISKEATAKWKVVKWAVKNPEYAACMGFFKAQDTLSRISEGAFREVQKQVDKIRKDSKLVNQVAREVEAFQAKYKARIDSAIKKALDLNRPDMLTKITTALKPKNMCKVGMSRAWKNLNALTSGKNQIRSRGAAHVWSLGPQLAGVFKGGGWEYGIGLAFQKPHKPKLYQFTGPTLSLPQAGGGVLIQIGNWFRPKVTKQKDLGGGYLAVGYAIPLKELGEHLYGYGNDYWANAEGGGSLVVSIDVLFSIFNGSPIWPPAGFVVSPGVVFSIAKYDGPFIKHLGRITLQGGYTWIGK